MGRCAQIIGHQLLSCIELLNNSPSPLSFVHISVISLHQLCVSFCLDQYRAACIRPPTLSQLQTRLFPYHATRSLQSVSSLWPFNPSTKAPKPHLCQNKEARSITTQCGRALRAWGEPKNRHPGLSKTSKTEGRASKRLGPSSQYQSNPLSQPVRSARILARLLESVGSK